uniref:Methyltransferase n=1 Tax=Solanum chacoense TaxID=4108 RepID=A0A0V0IW28_SOLCH
MQKSSGSDKENSYIWKLCNSTAGPDYIPCLDNLEAIRNLRSTKHYEHRERHCPDNPPTCLVPLPEGYQRSVEWPTSREKIWYHNVPHTKLAEIKGHQNWVKVSGEYLTFPGGGTQFKHGALHYIDFIQQSFPEIAWGKQTRVILDVGCGVASFGGYLFERDVLAMSLAPKDEHEAQVQFALERGIPAISAVMGTKRLPFPSRVFDVVHCARCRVPWHIEGGKLLLELNRVLRPGGLFVWSATPVYQKLPEDVEIWEAMQKLTNAMCWELVSKTKDRVNGVGVAVYRKPTSNECYEQRSKDAPPICQGSDDPNAAWNVPLQACMHKAPVATSERGSQWPEPWPARLSKSPYWLLSSQVGVYGKPAPEDFTADYEHWKHVVTNSYLNGMGINWSTVRNVMDMRAIYGGFAAALRDLNVWVMNVVSVDAPDTLPIIYERGLFGIYHDWCESFSTYPRSYDLVHADHLFSKINTKCGLPAIVAEVDRILRPGGKLIVRDKEETITELESMLKSMQYEINMTYSKDKEGLLYCQKTMWQPKDVETLIYAIA